MYVPFCLIHSDFIQQMQKLGNPFEDYWKVVSLWAQDIRPEFLQSPFLASGLLGIKVTILCLH